MPETNGTVLRAAGNNSIVGGDTNPITGDYLPVHKHGASDHVGAEVVLMPTGGVGVGGYATAAYSDFPLGRTSSSEPAGMLTEAAGYSGKTHSILQHSQNCYRYRRVARAA